MNTLDMILLIDDSDADNHYHTMVITRTKVPCRLKSLQGSLEGIDYLQKGLSEEDNAAHPIPQLIFLDINMPGLNGFEMLDKLRATADPFDRKKDIRIFMLSGSLNPDDQSLAREKYPDMVSGFCTKPLTESVFLDIVKRYF